MNVKQRHLSAMRERTRKVRIIKDAYSPVYFRLRGDRAPAPCVCPVCAVLAEVKRAAEQIA
jgi:hypothetical protein